MDNRDDMMQRIQVGVVGLVAVLLLVSVANFVMQRASDEKSAIEEIQETAEGGARSLEAEPAEPPSEPLADLGITPAPAPEEDDEKAAPTSSAPIGQVVPDLKPDPNLDTPMDQER